MNRNADAHTNIFMEWLSAGFQKSTECIGRDKVKNVNIVWNYQYESKEFGFTLRDNGSPLTLFQKSNAAQSIEWIFVERTKEYIKNILRRVIVCGNLNWRKKNIGLVCKVLRIWDLAYASTGSDYVITIGLQSQE